MKPVTWGVLALAGLGLAACGRPTVESPSAHHGRYVGIGIYEPGDLWQRMTTAAPAANASADAARLSDDEQVIVVVDSDTGEVRQCGNLSGYCVGMNPWTKALLAQQQAPVNLQAHNLKLPRVDGEPVPAAPAAPPPAKAP
ncbi:hypothetical protein QO010_001540 [Caulobacter ginsengisoli]|uniref:Uncharacterized protein n=1 Tax=Caulobacter ginsengisoli TaxID=400775 RepID=A0ABU0IRX2_9CAUL|nr:hypothetical protein [Caulobacter ginsengisoli]MDQ0463769.1 hypothetical protein [Caulobacter ginsengisoli]